VLNELVHDGADHVRRYRKADPDIAARAGQNHRIDADQLAIQADPRGSAPTPTLSASRLAAPAASPPPAPAAVSTPPDAGAPVEERLPAPAFFDGHTAADIQRRAPASLRADDLPAVDPALRSLQDAIVVAAKAHRLALQQQRRAKKASTAARSSPSAEPDDWSDPSPLP